MSDTLQKSHWCVIAFAVTVSLTQYWYWVEYSAPADYPAHYKIVTAVAHITQLFTTLTIWIVTESLLQTRWKFSTRIARFLFHYWLYVAVRMLSLILLTMATTICIFTAGETDSFATLSSQAANLLEVVYFLQPIILIMLCMYAKFDFDFIDQ